MGHQKAEGNSQRSIPSSLQRLKSPSSDQHLISLKVCNSLLKQSLERAGNSRLKMTTQDELSCYFINFSPLLQKGMQKKNEEEFFIFVLFYWESRLISYNVIQIQILARQIYSLNFIIVLFCFPFFSA